MDTPSLSSFAFKRRIFFPEQLRFLGNQSPSDPVRLLLRNRAGTFLETGGLTTTPSSLTG